MFPVMLRDRPDRALPKLPSGRHGLPRDYVVSNQRQRILDGTVSVVAGGGYAALTVEEIIAHAGVSRRTFYDHYANKEEAFLGAYDRIVEHLVAAVAAGFEQGSSWEEGVRHGLDAFLRALAGEPTGAHVCVVEILAAGPRALRHRADAIERFQREFAQRAPSSEGFVGPLAVEAAIGGLYEIVYRQVLRGQAAQLREIAPELLHSLLLPFSGPRVARAEYDAACRRRELEQAARSELRPPLG